MSDRGRKCAKGLLGLLVLGGLAAAAWTGVQSWRLRQAAADLAEALRQRQPPAVLDLATACLACGDLGSLGALLHPGSLTPAEREAARRFLAARESDRRRMAALTAAAQQAEDDGRAVEAVRRALAAALAAAAANRPQRWARCLDLAEEALAAAPSAETAAAGSDPRQAALAAAAALRPALDLHREVLSESLAPALRLAARAAALLRQGRYDQATPLLEMAGQLLGVEKGVGSLCFEDKEDKDDKGVGSLCFESLAPAEVAGEKTPDPFVRTRAKALVEFCQTVARSQPRAPIVQSLVGRAQRAWEADQSVEAAWWAELALETMGFGPEAVEAAVAAEAQP